MIDLKKGKEMYKILVFLLCAISVSAQYSSNYCTDPGFDNAAGWTAVAGAFSISGSKAVASGTSTSSKIVYRTSNTISTGKYFKWEITIEQYVAGDRIGIRHSSTLYDYVTISGNGKYSNTVLTTADYAYTVLATYDASGVNGYNFKADDFSVREKLDTLYIDPTDGLDTNYGQLSTPIKTWAEHIDRGTYEGGVVVQLVSGAWVDITSNGGLLVTTQDKGFKEYNKKNRLNSLLK